jgi:hypothetical protein
MKKLKTVVLGAGFVGRVQVEAIRRRSNVEVRDWRWLPAGVAWDGQ